jgi:hypothetical protein
MLVHMQRELTLYFLSRAFTLKPAAFGWNRWIGEYGNPPEPRMIHQLAVNGVHENCFWGDGACGVVAINPDPDSDQILDFKSLGHSLTPMWLNADS